MERAFKEMGNDDIEMPSYTPGLGASGAKLVVDFVP